MAGARVRAFLLRREQVDQQRRQAGEVELVRDGAVAGAVAATAGAVGEEDDAGRALRHGEVAVQGGGTGAELHRAVVKASAGAVRGHGAVLVAGRAGSRRVWPVLPSRAADRSPRPRPPLPPGRGESASSFAAPVGGGQLWGPSWRAARVSRS